MFFLFQQIYIYASLRKLFNHISKPSSTRVIYFLSSLHVRNDIYSQKLAHHNVPTHFRSQIRIRFAATKPPSFRSFTHDCSENCFPSIQYSDPIVWLVLAAGQAWLPPAHTGASPSRGTFADFDNPFRPCTWREQTTQCALNYFVGFMVHLTKLNSMSVQCRNLVESRIRSSCNVQAGDWYLGSTTIAEPTTEASTEHCNQYSTFLVLLFVREERWRIVRVCCEYTICFKVRRWRCDYENDIDGEPMVGWLRARYVLRRFCSHCAQCPAAHTCSI